MGTAIKNDRVITEVLARLKKRKYKLRFRREATCLFCFQMNEWIMPDDFTVDRYYYFEDILNPDAERMLYAISLRKGGRGFLIDACNVYTDNMSGEMMEKLQLNKTRKRRIDMSATGYAGKHDRTLNEALTF